MEELYCSTDIESDGPIPGVHSMMSLATVAYRKDKTIVGTFSANLLPLAGAIQHPETMAFWERFPEAFQRCADSGDLPKNAIKLIKQWIEEHKDELIEDWKLAQQHEKLNSIEPLE